MTGGTFSAERNPWITRAGAAVFLALAIGLIVSVGNPVRVLGYGPPASTPTCGGYHQICEAQVAGVRTAPRTPRAGKGFSVSFQTNSGGQYSIKARRKGASKSTKLSSGVTGAGAVTVKKLGKKLKRGEYKLTVTVKSTSNSTSDKASRTIKITKA